VLVVAEVLLARGDLAGGDPLEGGERAAHVGLDPDVDHRGRVELLERRLARPADRRDAGDARVLAGGRSRGRRGRATA
jgi:hypothetical protein